MDAKTVESANLNRYDEVVFTRNIEIIEAFPSCVVPVRMEKSLHGGMH